MIGDYDLKIKVRKVFEFLLDGDRIKVSLKFRGCEIIRFELGYIMMNKFYELVEVVVEKIKEFEIIGECFFDMYF